MKKLLMLMLAVLLFTVMASAEVMTFTFDTQENVDAWVSMASKDTEYSFDSAEKAIKITTKGIDPYISHDFPADAPLDADTYKYLVYRYKIVSGASSLAGASGQFFFTSDTLKAGKPGSYSNFALNAIDKWQEVIFDLSKLTWSGKVRMFRFDPVANVQAQVTMLVHSVTFTTSASEAADVADKFNSNPDAVAPQWIIDNYEIAERFNQETGQYASSFENGEWKLTVTDWDPTITFRFLENEQVRAESYPFVAFRMKVTTAGKEAGLFFATSAATAMGKTFSVFELKNNTGEWTDYIIDLSSYEHGLWTGNINCIRLDAINKGAVAGDTVQIDRFGIFKTEAEASEFLAKEVKINIIEGDIYEDPSTIINSGAKTPKWDMRTDEDVQKFRVTGSKLTYELGLYNLYSDSTDGRFEIALSKEDYFDAKEFHYFAMRYKTNSSANNGGFFFTNETFPSFKDDTFTSYRLNSTGNWENLVYDINTSTKSDVWDGKISGFRVDYLNPTPLGTEFTVSRIGFFRSRAEALEFLNGGSDEPDYTKGARYDDDYQSVIVPSGSLTPELTKDNFIIADAKGGDYGKDAVVSYIDANGNESIVALSNVNGYGYATYMARKPGTYKISSYTKSYDDIADHWGASYIDYVSSRKLFGGTSETEFSPEMSMTRGMFITVLGRMHGLDTSVYDGNTGYTDVPVTEYYAPYIQWAKEFSIMAPETETVFGAESPIYRKDMAIAIANYVKAYRYKLDELVTPVEFNDVASLTDDEKAAIMSVQAAAIINGKGEGKFDPMGVSTRAEVATVMQRVIKSVLGITLLPTEYDADYFTRDRIRIGVWGFGASLNTDEGVRTLAELGADLIVTGSAGGTVDGQLKLLTLADKYGIEVFASGMTTNENVYNNGIDYRAQAASYVEHPSFTGHYFTDEPGDDDFDWMGDMANEYQAANPGKRPFVNLLPMYANAAQLKYGASAAAIEYYDSDPELYRKHCQAWFENFDVDYICTDIYPLNWASGNKKLTRKEYIEYINQIATVARENNAEFWCCIQTFGWTAGKRTPNEAEYRWQSYCMLSFGATGILLWNYMGYPDYPSLVHPVTLEKTQAYEDCKPVMWELRAISDVFVKYRNLGVYTVNCTNGKPDYLAMTGEYRDFATIKSIDCKDPLLVGCFTAKDGDSKAFTITNMLDFQGNEAKTTPVSFVLDDMSKTVTSYYRGTPTVLTPENGAYSIVLECGDGVFITVE